MSVYYSVCEAWSFGSRLTLCILAGELFFQLAPYVFITNNLACGNLCLGLVCPCVQFLHSEGAR